jgi:signal peptidase I
MVFWNSLATFLAPGFAQALAGRRLRAGLWLAAAFVAYGASTRSVWFALVSLPLHVAAAIDGWICLRRTERHARDLASTIVLVVGLGVALLLGVVTQAFRIPSSSMYPTLQIGDHILVDKLSRGVARGEPIIFHYPCAPGRDYMHRAIAIAGDTVEVRCGTVYVNGTAAADALVDGNASYVDYDEDRGRWSETPTPVAAYRETIDGRSFGIFHSRDAERRADRDFPRDTTPASCASSMEPSAVQQTLGQVVEAAPDDPAKPCGLHRHYVVPPGHVFVLGDNRENANDSRVWGAVPLANVVGRTIGIWWSRGHDGVDLGRIGRVD